MKNSMRIRARVSTIAPRIATSREGIPQRGAKAIVAETRFGVFDLERLPPTRFSGLPTSIVNRPRKVAREEYVAAKRKGRIFRLILSFLRAKSERRDGMDLIALRKKASYAEQIA